MSALIKSFINMQNKVNSLVCKCKNESFPTRKSIMHVALRKQKLIAYKIQKSEGHDSYEARCAWNAVEAFEQKLKLLEILDDENVYFNNIEFKKVNDKKSNKKCIIDEYYVNSYIDDVK